MAAAEKPNEKTARPAKAVPNERPVPHDLEAERAVLGAILVNADAFDIAADLLEPGHFFRDAHQRVFRAMLAMQEASRSVDVLTLKAELQRTGQLDEIGGPAYLAALADGIPRSTNVKQYAGIVRELAQLRAAIETSEKLKAEAMAPERSSSEMLSDAAERLLDLSGSALAGKPTRLSELVAPGMDALEKSAAAGGGTISGISTGFAKLDEMTAGMHEGELWLLAARTSQGKTSLAMNIARHVSLSANVLVFSLEMSKQQLFLRMLASEARVNSHQMRTGYLHETDWPKLAEAIQLLSEVHLYIDDTPSIGVREVRARARQLRQDKGSLGLIIVDYIQLMKGRGRFDNRQQEIGTISRGLKAVGKELGVPVVALAQLSRAMEAGPGKKGRRPQLSDLRESGDLENDADVVLFIYRPEGKDDEAVDQAELIIGKQRNGPVGMLKVGWDASCVTFYGLDMT